jgi:hypothetical protein
LALLVLVLLGHFMGSNFVHENSGGEVASAIVGGALIVLGWVLFVLVEAFGVLYLVSGARLAQGRSRTFSMVVAALDCLSFPFGTALGVWTLITLSDVEVRAVYEGGAAR